MNTLNRFCLASFLLCFAAYGYAENPAPAYALDQPAAVGCNTTAHKIDEARFIPIGGIEQWVTIKGDNCSNPVILFIHGGPGDPLSPFADSVYGGWAKDFTLVQWDQRGSGMTFGRSPPAAGSTLTIDRMTDDGVQVASYLTQHLGQRKVILMGSSWGSILAIHMIKARPDLFYAYVGASQMVSYRENQNASYAKVLELARAANDEKTIATVEALGPPPWTNPRNFGILRRAIRKYEAKATIPAPQAWWVPAPAYATPGEEANYEGGEDFSYLQFVGLNGDGMFAQVDLPKLGTTFQVPIFFIQGSEDILTAPEVTRRYFESISAPQKAFIVVPEAGHDPNVPMVDAEYEVVRERILPLPTNGL
ncbi:MAG TPA: alpha/beta hydrolase [Candidatus Acidoferrales bacterium]|jgi:pimeloyl-ACP methyl ester carboxylesterase|nr:alpha/beta hydrolase [Candidatus Acidoferrales bacterium]